MKKIVLALAVVLVAVSAFAGGGKSCKTEAKNVQLTGVIACADGATGENCARVFRVANSDTQYTICDKSKASLTKLNGANVRVSGKVVACDESGGQELFIEKAKKI
ncbi:MAG TPA: hypothetical protein VMS98_04795 [Thermoanaerobaculia bacterium]|nr:hypothetical protein [Thermoanaerobaculia bacterium]